MTVPQIESSGFFIVAPPPSLLYELTARYSSAFRLRQQWLISLLVYFFQRIQRETARVRRRNGGEIADSGQPGTRYPARALSAGHDGNRKRPGSPDPPLAQLERQGRLDQPRLSTSGRAFA